MAMWLYFVFVVDVRDEMRQFMHQCYKKCILIEIAIDGNGVIASFGIAGEVTEFCRTWRGYDQMMRILSQLFTHKLQRAVGQKCLKGGLQIGALFHGCLRLIVLCGHSILDMFCTSVFYLMRRMSSPPES